jgi:hypothetical protein
MRLLTSSNTRRSAARPASSTAMEPRMSDEVARYRSSGGVFSVKPRAPLTRGTMLTWVRVRLRVSLG